MNRTDIINFFIQKYNYKSYLEIGLDDPNLNYINVNCEHKESVDPFNGGNYYDPSNLPQIVLDNLTYRMGSDELFENMPLDKKYDIIFIDGLHEYKQVARDIVNSFKHLNKNGKIIVHDTMPISEETASDVMPSEPVAWYGSVYKTIMQIDKIVPIFYTKEATDDEVGLTILEYFPGCETIEFEPEDITYQDYEQNCVRKMHVIDEKTFLQIYDGFLKLFEIGHKPWTPSNGLVIPLQVSSYFNGENICPLKDSYGYNISKYNQLYGELTGIFWIWRNCLNGTKYIGQSAYRRPFMLCGRINFDNIFNMYDIILPNPLYFNETVYEQYNLWHNISDLDLVFDIIREKYPEYENDIEKCKQQKFLYNGNGFIMKVEDYNKYCSFLFDITFEWQKRMNIYSLEDMSNYLKKEINKGKFHWFSEEEADKCISYQRRAIGFLSERIFNVYISHNFHRIYHIPYSLTETDY